MALSFVDALQILSMCLKSCMGWIYAGNEHWYLVLLCHIKKWFFLSISSWINSSILLLLLPWRSEVNGALEWIPTAHPNNRIAKKGVNHDNSPLGGIGTHFIDFHRRYSPLFQLRTRDISHISEQYFKGLIQAKKKNMERMAEAVPNSDDQVLQHFLTNSGWDDQL